MIERPRQIRLVQVLCILPIFFRQFLLSARIGGLGDDFGAGHGLHLLAAVVVVDATAAVAIVVFVFF